MEESLGWLLISLATLLQHTIIMPPQSSSSITFLSFFLAFSMDCQLAEFEAKHNVVARWTMQDRQYVAARKMYTEERREQLRTSLWAAVVKRHYLLKMKAKYAGE